MFGLPPEVQDVVGRRLEGRSRRDLASRSKALSDAYRASGGSAAAIGDRDDIAVYLTARMPATFAAVAAALREARLAAPDFAPDTILDVGAGPGTASIAALEAWPDVRRVTLVDHHRPMLDVARDIAAASALPALRGAEIVHADAVRSGTALPRADLVLVAYALAELPDAQALALAGVAWDRCDRMLVLVEPGTPAGFARIRAARAALLSRGATVCAPCPHDAACPIVAPDWCHFAQRVARSRDHRLVKNATVPFEDEKYAYVALARAPAVARPRARVVRPAQVTKVGWASVLCSADGRLAPTSIPRRAPDFRRVRRLDWGDAVTD